MRALVMRCGAFGDMVLLTVLLATAGKAHPRMVLAVYIPLILVSTLCAVRFMDNLSQAANEKRAMRDVSRDPHTWIMSFLYIGTFGSFIGFGFAFGQVLQVQFKSSFDTPVKAAYLTFLGPLLGSLIRPIGGRLADRYSGSLVTFCTFIAMAAGASVVLYASTITSLPLFIAGFIAARSAPQGSQLEEEKRASNHAEWDAYYASEQAEDAL